MKTLLSTKNVQQSFCTCPLVCQSLSLPIRASSGLKKTYNLHRVLTFNNRVVLSLWNLLYVAVNKYQVKRNICFQNSLFVYTFPASQPPSECQERTWKVLGKQNIVLCIVYINVNHKIIIQCVKYIIVYFLCIQCRPWCKY